MNHNAAPGSGGIADGALERATSCLSLRRRALSVNRRHCCTPKQAADWLFEVQEAAEVDADMARLTDVVEEHLRRVGGVVEPPWWAR